VPTANRELAAAAIAASPAEGAPQLAVIAAAITTGRTGLFITAVYYKPEQARYDAQRDQTGEGG
jgi:hypothetical protein